MSQIYALYKKAGNYFLLLVLLVTVLAGSSRLNAQTDPTGSLAEPIHTVFLPLIAVPPPPRILIAAAHIDSATSGEPDEAIMLWNVGATAQALAGWQITSGSRSATVPLTSTLQIGAGQRLWCTAQAVAFRTTSPDEPGCEWALDSDPTVENLQGKLGFTNSGGFIKLANASGEVVDTLLYGNETLPQSGWTGAAAQIYTRGGTSANGQIWQRKLHPQSWLPIDSDQASDWAGDLNDLLWGRRVRMPGWGGWSAADRGMPVSATATASVTVLVGPEGLYAPLNALLGSAQTTIDLSI